MSLSEQQVRDEVIKAYNSDYYPPNNEVWRRKVLRMKYSQVFAIYIRLKRQGKIK